MGASESVGRQAGQAADHLHAAVYPGDELRGPRSDLPPEVVATLQQAVDALGEAEDALSPGLGPPDVEAGGVALAYAREVLKPFETGLPFMEQGLRRAIHAALDVARSAA